MHRTDWLPLFAVGLLLTVTASQSREVAAEGGGLSEVELEQLANLPEEQIDIGQVALFLATEVFPGLDVNKYSAQLDGFVKEIRDFTRGSTDSDYRIRAMNTYLYKRQGFHYDKSDPLAQQLMNRYLNGLLDTQAGSCTTMPLLYLALAQRLGYPVYPVAAPQHLFCRYAAADVKEQNIEATEGGGYSSDADYIRDMEIPTLGIKSGAYLSTMTYRQLVGDLIAENGSYWARQKDFVRAIKYYIIAVRLNPNAAEVYQMLSQAYRQLARDYQAVTPAQLPINVPVLQFTQQLYTGYVQGYLQDAEEAFQRAEELGAAEPLNGDYQLRQQELARSKRKGQE